MDQPKKYWEKNYKKKLPLISERFTRVYELFKDSLVEEANPEVRGVHSKMKVLPTQ